MAKYVARVRKDANSYRYFYSPAEYQAYLKSKGSGKTFGEKLSGAVDTAKKKVHKYVYNKNAEKKLNEMGKAHELDERSKQNAQMNPTPGSHRDNMTDKSTVNRRTIEAVYGGQLKKSSKRGEGYVHTYSGTIPKTTEANTSTPNVGKMQDAIYKTLQDQQRQSNKKKALESKKEAQKKASEAYESNASGKAADAKAKTAADNYRKNVKAEHKKNQNLEGHAKDEAYKANKKTESKPQETEKPAYTGTSDGGKESNRPKARKKNVTGKAENPVYKQRKYDYDPTTGEVLVPTDYTGWNLRPNAYQDDGYKIPAAGSQYNAAKASMALTYDSARKEAKKKKKYVK